MIFRGRSIARGRRKPIASATAARESNGQMTGIRYFSWTCVVGGFAQFSLFYLTSARDLARRSSNVSGVGREDCQNISRQQTATNCILSDNMEGADGTAGSYAA